MMSSGHRALLAILECPQPMRLLHVSGTVAARNCAFEDAMSEVAKLHKAAKDRVRVFRIQHRIEFGENFVTFESMNGSAPWCFHKFQGIELDKLEFDDSAVNRKEYQQYLEFLRTRVRRRSK